MRNKKNLKAIISATHFSLKNIGFIRFVPYITFDFLYPILLIWSRKSSIDINNLEIYFLQFTQIVFPFFSVWNTILISREYMESEGNEVLYLHRSIGLFCLKLMTFSLPFFNVALLMIITCYFIPSFSFEIFRILSACVFFFGLCCFILCIFKSTIFSFLGCAIYLLSNYFIKGEKIIAFFYMSNVALNAEGLLITCLPLLLGGLLFLFLDKAVSNRFKIFN